MRFEIDRYRVLLRGQLNQSHPQIQEATIIVNDDGDEHSLAIHFGDESNLPPPIIGLRESEVSLPSSHYPRYIDLLRNESPLFAAIVSERLFGIFSREEDIGEGE